MYYYYIRGYLYRYMYDVGIHDLYATLKHRYTFSVSNTQIDIYRSGPGT